MTQTRRKTWAARGVVGIALLVVIFPLYWILITSFKSPSAVSGGPTYLPFVDFVPTTAAWEWMLFTPARNDLTRALFNSLFAAGFSSLLATGVGAMAGYGLARFQYRWGPWRNDDIAFFFLSQRMLPPVAAVLAFLVMFATIGILDTRTGLTLVYFGFVIPFAIWVMRDTFLRIPVDIEESAAIDGCTRWQAFIRIGLPLAKPGLVASFLFCFIFSWNEYLFALMLTFQEATTIPLLLQSRITSLGAQWARLSSLTIVNLVPAAILGVMLERYLVRNQLEGAGK